MTTKLIAPTKQDAPKQAAHWKDEQLQDEQDEHLAVFPEYPPRGDMNNPLYLHESSHMRSLAIHFGRDETTFVMSEVPISTTATIRREHRRPDLIVAFNCDRDLLISQKGYSIVTQGKPPDFVLEVASESTGEVDYTDKRAEYESYGIPEYWRFDSSGGFYHDAALAGDRLVEGEYKPIEIEMINPLNRRGYSAALDLWLCWEYGQLRLYDAKVDEYLRSHDDEYDRAELEAYERQQADLRAALAENRAEDAEARAALAENRAEDAEARAEDAEAENRRLRAELEAVRRSVQSDEKN